MSNIFEEKEEQYFSIFEEKEEQYFSTFLLDFANLINVVCTLCSGIEYFGGLGEYETTSYKFEKTVLVSTPEVEYRMSRKKRKFGIEHRL